MIQEGFVHAPGRLGSSSEEATFMVQGRFIPPLGRLESCSAEPCCML